MIKHIHVICILTSFSLFFVRGIWMVADSRFQYEKWTKWLPPVVDTLLLTSAVILVVKIEQYPFVNSWLTVKVISLFLYIALGMVALTYGKTKRIRVISWVGAQLVFVYIVLVALTKNPFLTF